MQIWLFLLFISFLFTVLNYCFLFSKNTIKIMNIFLSILVFIVFGFNRMNRDYTNYIRIFETGGFKTEKGYLILIEAVKK